ncbi:PH domain-containing protein [Deinococcus oregonensis]|uniref:PH domain-containing protein n=1 Tax=Deinococcus oregonensis TaxID=1805970 RepID=A0ABV6AWM1_9DEIO
MTEGRHDVSLSYKPNSALPGGLGKHAIEALLPGEQILLEAHTNMGEAAVLTSSRLLLVRAGFTSTGLGKVHAFGFDEILDVIFQDYGLVKKLRVISKRPVVPAHELNVGSQAKEVDQTKKLVEKLAQFRPITGGVKQAEYALAHHRSKLPGKLGEAIEATLRAEEQVLREIHIVGEGLVVTDQRVLIVKGGSAAQAMFGQKVKSYPFDAITSIEVSAGVLFGRIQITVPGSGEGAGRSAGPGATAQMENVVQIHRPMLPEARAIANFIEEHMAAAKQPKMMIAAVPALPVSAPSSLADELKKLAELRAAGILNQDEFEAAKQRLLNF